MEQQNSSQPAPESKPVGGQALGKILAKIPDATSYVVIVNLGGRYELIVKGDPGSTLISMEVLKDYVLKQLHITSTK